jgi:hypothetical protein
MFPLSYHIFKILPIYLEFFIFLQEPFHRAFGQSQNLRFDVGLRLRKPHQKSLRPVRQILIMSVVRILVKSLTGVHIDVLRQHMQRVAFFPHGQKRLRALPQTPCEGSQLRNLLFQLPIIPFPVLVLLIQILDRPRIFFPDLFSFPETCLRHIRYPFQSYFQIR